MSKPSEALIRMELAALRRIIESYDTPHIETRMAQVAEHALRWATEDTDWSSPAKEVQKMADILRRDFKS